jgi:hypothetical protein
VEALLDTGFGGDVMAPSSVIPAGELPIVESNWTFPDGFTISAPAYFGMIQLDQLGTYGVVVAALGNEVLVGRGVLDRFKVCFDHGQRVTLEL